LIKSSLLTKSAYGGKDGEVKSGERKVLVSGEGGRSDVGSRAARSYGKPLSEKICNRRGDTAEVVLQEIASQPDECDVVGHAREEISC